MINKWILLMPLLCLLLASCNKPKSPADIIITALPPDYSQEISIDNAYCMDTHFPSASFPFRFTLTNIKNENINVNYLWTLNDPQADGPGPHKDNTNGRVYVGEGKTSLVSFGKSPIEVEIREVREYDPRFYVMYIGVYQNGRQIAYYRGQKSTYDWDYSTIPPTLNDQ